MKLRIADCRLLRARAGRPCSQVMIFTCLCISGVALRAGAGEYAPPEKAKALDALKQSVAAAVKSGEKVEARVSILGVATKAQLTAADAKALTVQFQGHPFALAWEKITPTQLAGIGKNCAQGDAHRELALADYCFATEQVEQADEALEFLASVKPDAKLAEAINERRKYSAGLKAAAQSQIADAGTGSNIAASGTLVNPQSADSSLPAPAKVAFRPSEPGKLTPVKEVAAAVDNAIEIGLAGMGIRPEPLCDDTAFLRRASLDLTGQIPTPEEVLEFYREGSSGKREKKIDELLKRPEYADHWATFWNVLLVGRRTREEADVKPSVFKTWLREEFSKNERFDKIVTDLLTATGENDKDGPANYLSFHLSDTLPNTMAHVSQTFLGARIGCAQCHDHPFDKWSQADFWGFSSFLASTRSERRQERKDPKDPKTVTREWHVLVDQGERNGGGRYDPPEENLRLPPKYLGGAVFGAAAPKEKSGRKRDLGATLGSGSGMEGGMSGPGMAGGTGMSGMTMDNSMSMMGGETKDSAPGNQGLKYRRALARWITNPGNTMFAQSAVNRYWRTLFGYGLVEPVDDIRPKNPPSFPDVMAILGGDFSASGGDLQRLCAIIANTRAYQRTSWGTAAKADRAREVRYAARAEVRPMSPEMLFAAVLKATGGDEKAQALRAGLTARDQAMMKGGYKGAAEMDEDAAEMYALLQRFINTSTAEDRAGKLQFEGTVSQSLMLMHSPFIQRAIKAGVERYRKKGMGNLDYIFAGTLSRPLTPEESGAFGQFNGGLEGIMWVLLNSSEFVTIH